MADRKRSIKPFLYVGGACLSLLTVAHFLDPILALKERGISSAVASNLLGDAAGIDLAALGAMVSGEEEQSAAPKEIVVVDVRTIDGPDKAVREQFSQAVTLQSKQEFEKAEALYLQVLEREPKHSAAHRNLAVLFCQTGEFEKAWTHVQAVELLGQNMPQGFLEILEASLPDPRKDKTVGAGG